jgi:hypothetical protein
MTPAEAIAYAPIALRSGNPRAHPPIFLWFTKRASELKFLSDQPPTDWGDHAPVDDWQPDVTLGELIVGCAALVWLTFFLVAGYAGVLL